MIANVFEIFVSICVAVVARALHQWICFSAVSLSAVSSILLSQLNGSYVDRAIGLSSCTSPYMFASSQPILAAD
jgi:hypothetical protein